MAYAQWVQISITSVNFDSTIKNLKLYWGKLHEKGNKDKELKVSEVEGKLIGKNQVYDINACGRSDSASGTEGKFSLYNGNEELARFYWNCPWGSKKNSFQHEKVVSDGYMMEVSDYNQDSGALGQVSIKIVKM